MTIIKLLYCRIIDLFVVFLLFFSMPGDVYSSFSSRGYIKNTSFSTGIWAPPTAPKLKNPKRIFKTNQDQFFEWSVPTLIYFLPVSYVLEIYDADPTPPNTFQLVHSFSGLTSERCPPDKTLPLTDGTYFWRVKAVDAINQESVWSEVYQIIIDKTPPETIIKIENGGIYDMNEQIDDGTFEKYQQTLQNSNFVNDGDVVLWQSNDAYQANARVGNRMVRIGSVASQPEGVNLLQNKLSYTFSNNSKNIAFYYNYFSSDEYPFDDPGFVFKINDNFVFGVGADDVNGSSLIKNTGWKQFYYDISNFTGNVTIAFYAGNNLDNFRQSWVYLDEIKTGRAVLNARAKFLLTVSDANSYYCWDQCDENGIWNQYQVPFSLPADLSAGNHEVYFYGVDYLGNRESNQVKPIFFDNVSPLPITDLTAKEIKNNAASFVFTAPAEVVGYEIKIADSQEKLINQWEIIPKLDIKLIPNAVQVLEEFVINNLESNKTYYLGVKSFDAAVNYSAISNIVQFKTSLKNGDILIQELLYDVLNDSPEETYEWIKLYNATSEAIDLTNWYVSDNSNNVNKLNIKINPRSFLILTPSTLLFQTKYLFYDGQIMQIAETKFGNSLSNSGDFVKLFDLFGKQWDEVGWETNILWPGSILQAPSGASIIRKTLSVDTNAETDWMINPSPLSPLP